MSLNGIIDAARLGTGFYVVTRTVAETRVLGRPVPGASSTFTTNLGIEPATGRQLQDLLEAQRGDETIMIYSPVELKTRMPGFAADQVEYLGEQWTVVSSKRWEGFGEIHWEAMAQRAPIQQGGTIP